MKDHSPWYLDWFNEDYDKLYAHRDENEAKNQVNFLFKALNLNGKEKVLDLGCGSGRQAIFLAEKGMDVVGIDISPVQIQKALHKSKNLPYSLHFFVEDMRNIADLGQFDLIVSFFTSFGYFDEDEENEKVIRAVSKTLKNEGQFFLDYLHPDQVRRALIPHETRKLDGEDVEILRRIEGTSIIKQIKFPHHHYEERVKLYSRTEIDKMLQMNHLRIVNAWDDYKRTPWRPDGNRQLFHIKKC